MGTVELMFRFMGVSIGKARNFYQNQHLYRNRIVKYQRMAEYRSEAARSHVRLAIDVRYDSPGKM